MDRCVTHKPKSKVLGTFGAVKPMRSQGRQKIDGLSLAVLTDTPAPHDGHICRAAPPPLPGLSYPAISTGALHSGSQSSMLYLQLEGGTTPLRSLH